MQPIVSLTREIRLAGSCMDGEVYAELPDDGDNDDDNVTHIAQVVNDLRALQNIEETPLQCGEPANDDSPYIINVRRHRDLQNFVYELPRRVTNHVIDELIDWLLSIPQAP